MCRHLRRLIPSRLRTGKVMTSTNKGRFSAIEVSVTPPTLVSDVCGYPLPRRELIVEATKLLQELRVVYFYYLCSNLNFFGSILPSSSGHGYRSLWTYEQFSQDGCFHENIMLRYICSSRLSGVDSLGSLAKFQRDGLRTYCRNIASIASTPERNESFAKLNSDDISYFKKV